MAESFGDWYDKNKEDYNAERRARYKRDTAYKKRVQSYTRRYRDGKPRRVRQDDGSVSVVVDGKLVRGFRTGHVAKVLGVNAEAIRYLEKQGYIRNASSGEGKIRLYIESQIDLIRRAFGTRSDYNTGVITKDQRDQIKQDIHQEWENDGEH